MDGYTNCFNCNGLGWFDVFDKPCNQNNFHVASMCKTCNGQCRICSGYYRCRICSGKGALDLNNRPTRSMVDYVCPGCNGDGIDKGVMPCERCHSRRYLDVFGDACGYEDAHRTCTTCSNGARVRRPGLLGCVQFFCS